MGRKSKSSKNINSNLTGWEKKYITNVAKYDTNSSNSTDSNSSRSTYGNSRQKK